ncbi:MAG: DUF374 domain-containing protein [Acidobacteria bacterium]|nr:MAG: DUF374 domain-containing protein [Acidobacteriota bacterium]
MATVKVGGAVPPNGRQMTETASGAEIPQPGWARRLAPWLAAWLVRGLHATMRIRHVHREELQRLQDQGQNYIIAFWHGQLLMMTYCYTGQRMAILISHHADGELIARTMNWLGYESVRGSSSRGGRAALKALVSRLRSGWDIAFTPDGPRGPRWQAQPGVIQAARLCGVPIVPVAFSAHPARVFSSWDKFLLPYPFSRGVFTYGKPVYVARDSTREFQEASRLNLENTLVDLTKEADRLAGRAE